VAALAGLGIGLGFAGVSLPLFLADPAIFGPLHVQQKLKDVGPDWVQPAVIAAGMLVAAWGGGRARDGDGLFRALALVMAIPTLTAVLLYSLRVGQPSFNFYGWYGISSVFFAALGYWRQVLDGRAAGRPGGTG
jgi:hypothetical protein